MRLLDLFCGGGGCSVGYHRAGFEVVGVDIVDRPNYPFEFHRADAMEFPLGGFEVIHASPPCQLWAGGHSPNRASYPDLIAPIRDRLMESGTPYVIENVMRAPLIDPIMVCGGSLGCVCGDMQLHRHRAFESSLPIVGTECAKVRPITLSVTGTGTPTGSYVKLGRAARVWEFKEIMGIDWMTRKELSQAIPPAYTEHIGRQLLVLIGATRPGASGGEVDPPIKNDGTLPTEPVEPGWKE